MNFKLTGPKGGLLVKSASLQRLKAVLPGLVKRFKKVSVSADPVHDPRAAIVLWARWGVMNEPQIHYAEIRPMPLTAKLPCVTDCSGFVTLCYKLAGAPDPNGNNFNGIGYTGTLLTHGIEIPASQVKPGDVVIYGPGTGVHTAVCVSAGPDPLTVSHGEEKGPEYVRVSQDNRQPVRFHSYL